MDVLILIVGKSGSGKDTIVKYLCNKYNYTQLKSYTTRNKRSETEDTHIFITEEEFNKLDNIVAYTEFNNYRYCATQEQCDNSDFYIIDPDGVDYFKEKYNGNKTPIIIYMDVPFVKRFKRMLERGDSIKSAIKRILYDREKFNNINFNPDYIIMNNNFGSTCLKLMKIIGENSNGLNSTGLKLLDKIEKGKK